VISPSRQSQTAVEVESQESQSPKAHSLEPKTLEPYRGWAVLPPDPPAPPHPRTPPEPDELEPDEPEPDEPEPDELEPDELEPDELEPDELEPDERDPDEPAEPDEPPAVARDRAVPTIGAGCGVVPVISGPLGPVVPGEAGDPPRV
jgi:hypothetical protein